MNSDDDDDDDDDGDLELVSILTIILTWVGIDPLNYNNQYIDMLYLCCTLNVWYILDCNSSLGIFYLVIIHT